VHCTPRIPENSCLSAALWSETSPCQCRQKSDSTNLNCNRFDVGIRRTTVVEICARRLVELWKSFIDTKFKDNCLLSTAHFEIYLPEIKAYWLLKLDAKLRTKNLYPQTRKFTTNRGKKPTWILIFDTETAQLIKLLTDN
jgi:hypothetical protein